ncbi:hypothetical protein [Deinococcus radiophilus]|uniref:hypothetical protein n=1 Tax=Deinococcus radiophilus TaxID=32062 RepID=UPI003613CD72
MQQARELDPAIGTEPLYQALDAELQIKEGHLDVGLKLPAELLAAPDPLAQFHALTSLVLVGDAPRALEVQLEPAELPAHLAWRAAALQAEAHEALGDAEQASALYAQAAAGAQGPDRAVMLQEMAATDLARGELDAAGAALAEARSLYSAQPEDGGEALASPPGTTCRPSWTWLRAALTRPHRDQSGCRTGRAIRDPSYGVALVQGQVLSALGRSEEALTFFGRAAELAQPGDRAYAQHELAVALLDLDRPLEAQEMLETVAREGSYPFQAEILADLAECDYRLGQLAQAQAGAEQALSQGAVIPASLVLGNVALEYYHLDDALTHFARVIGTSPPGSREWLVGQQMTADILAQQGFRNPAQVYAHAQQAWSIPPKATTGIPPCRPTWTAPPS